jgi:hypothetical protein
MRAYGDIDFDNKIIRINMSKNPDKKYNVSKPDELIDTYLHEIIHAKYPKMTEKDVRAKVKEIINSMSEQDKTKLKEYIIKLAK